MHYAERIFARGMYGAVNRKTGWIDGVRRVHCLVAVRIDLHQTRGSDFIEHHPIRIEQKMMLSPRHARRDMREDQIIPTVKRDQAIRRGKIDARLPFLLGYLLADRRWFWNSSHCFLFSASCQNRE